LDVKKEESWVDSKVERWVGLMVVYWEYPLVALWVSLRVDSMAGIKADLLG
jgi:hypothetical protein